MILLDTNVIVAGVDGNAPAFPICRAVLEGAKSRMVPGVLVPQVLLEAFAIITDHRRVGRPVAPVEAWEGLGVLAGALPVVYPEPGVFAEFAEIVMSRRPTGQVVFDAFLVAQMRTLNIGTICTYDAKGFSGYQGISVETPETLVARYRLMP